MISCGQEGCDFSLFIEQRGHLLTDTEIAKLLRYRKTDPVTLKSKDGKSYQAMIILNDQFKTGIEFANNGKPSFKGKK